MSEFECLWIWKEVILLSPIWFDFRLVLVSEINMISGLYSVLWTWKLFLFDCQSFLDSCLFMYPIYKAIFGGEKKKIFSVMPREYLLLTFRMIRINA